ncbi:ABC transporter substrate-binding protein [Nocardioides sp. J54]|uniref:ABC transporter substrate-binding protein n=1 Tax=Nocardioides sp. J54 TaxID=935866 RepID=UPI00049071DB|nr:ABC transporter substrate-binding protein [Nocardioides sp. J54]
MKRRLLAATTAVTLSLTMAACGAASDSSGGDAEEGPIKIALIPPTSGALAQFGTDSVKGWETAVRLVNEDGGIDGREVELLVKGTDADPATTLRVAKEAVTQDGAQFIGSVMTSPEHGALNAQLEGLGALSFNSLGKDDALVGEQCSPYAVHVVQTTSMDVNALANSIAEMPGEKWAIQAVDYATGHSAAETFKAAAEKAGKEVVLEQFAPLNTTDFGSYITKLKNSGADAVFAVEFGADGVAFVQQADQFNLDDQLKTVLGLNMVSEPLFETLGESIVGYYNNVGYDAAADTEANKEFIEAYTEDHGSAPYYVPADAYAAAQILFAGIEEAGSSEPAEVAEALADLTVETNVGEVTVRGTDNQVLRDSYLGKVVKGDGGLAFEVVTNTSADVTTTESDPACKF